MGPQSRVAQANPAWLAALVFFIVSLLYFSVFRTPPILADALDYFDTARLLPDVTATHRHLRIGLLVPLSGLIKAVGYSEIAYYATPWFSCFLLGFSTWWLGRVLFSARVGWMAGLTVMLLPPYAAHLSMLLPDYLSAGLFTLGITLVSLGAARPGGRDCTIWRDRSAWLFLAAGVLVGWSYLVREFVALFFPCLGLAMLVLRVPLRGWVALAAGALGMYGLELAWGAVVYGDPLVRLTTAGAPRDTRLDLSMDVLDVLTQFPTRFTGRAGGWLLAAFSVLGFVAMVAGALRGRAAWRVLACWALAGWVLFTGLALLPILVLGEGTTYLRMHLFRYWAMILPPVFIAASAACFVLHDRLQSMVARGPAMLALLAVLMVPVMGVTLGLRQLASHPGLVRNAPDYQEFRAYVASGALPETIWMDSGTTVSADKSLPMYFRSPSGFRTFWGGEVKVINTDRSTWLAREEIHGGVVLFDRSRADRIFNRHTPDYYRAPETVWQTVFRSSNGRILVLDPDAPAPVAESSLVLDPAAFQVRAAVGEGIRHRMTPEGGLHLQVPNGARAVLTDDAAPGLRPPPENRNLLPEGGVSEMRGEVLLARKGGRTSPLAVRCLFYDRQGERRAVWADLAAPLPGPGRQERYLFACKLPADGFDAERARLLLQLSSGSDVVLAGVGYGFVAAPSGQ